MGPWEHSHGGVCGALPHIEGYVGSFLTRRGVVGSFLTQSLRGIPPGAVGPSLTRRDVWDPPSHPGMCGTLSHRPCGESPQGPWQPSHRGLCGTLPHGACGESHQGPWEPSHGRACGTLLHTHGRVEPSLTGPVGTPLPRSLAGSVAGAGPAVRGAPAARGRCPAVHAGFPGARPWRARRGAGAALCVAPGTPACTAPGTPSATCAYGEGLPGPGPAPPVRAALTLRSFPAGSVSSGSRQPGLFCRGRRRSPAPRNRAGPTAPPVWKRCRCGSPRALAQAPRGPRRMRRRWPRWGGRRSSSARWVHGSGAGGTSRDG